MVVFWLTSIWDIGTGGFLLNPKIYSQRFKSNWYHAILNLVCTSSIVPFAGTGMPGLQHAIQVQRVPFVLFDLHNGQMSVSALKMPFSVSTRWPSSFLYSTSN